MSKTTLDAFERCHTLADHFADWKTIAFRERGFAHRWNQPARRTGKVCGLSEEQMLDELWEDEQARRHAAELQEQPESITPEASKEASVVSGASSPAGMAGLKDAARTQIGERTMLKRKTKAAKNTKSSKLPIVRRGDKGMKPWTPTEPEALQPVAEPAPTPVETPAAEPPVEQPAAPVVAEAPATPTVAPASDTNAQPANGKRATKRGKTKKAPPAAEPQVEPTVAPPIDTAAPATNDEPAAKSGKSRKAKSKPTKANEPTTKPARTEKPSGKMSCLDAAAAVLKKSGAPMRCREMVDAMHTQKLWSSDAPTPHQTLASAILREITKKGAESRFRKADRGQFELNR
jgi:hypothetical protein